MFRRISACVSVLTLLVLAGCEDSGPFGLDQDFEKSSEFELFDGGWASVHENGPSGFPNVIHNGGFEAGLADWFVLPAPGWEVTPAAKNSGSLGLRGSVADGFAFVSQEVDLPDEATIRLAWSHRYENTSAAESIWSSTSYQVQLFSLAFGTVTVWNAGDVESPAPRFSGGGESAVYERLEVDISLYRDTDLVRLIFVVSTPDEFSFDLDDIEIFVVPGGADFDTLTITDAKVKVHKKRDRGKSGKEPKLKDEFEIKKGELLLEEGFVDGFDLDEEDLIITFGTLPPFTIDHELFVRDADHGKWKFRGKKPGITHVDIRDDGRFKVKAKGLDLSFIDLKDKDKRTVNFMLTIGEDSGSFDIDFDKKGRFKVKKSKPDD